MGQKSSIKKLSKAVREDIDALLAKGEVTIDQLVEHIQGLGADVSRSAAGRHKKQFDDVSRKMREAREVAGALVADLGEDAGDDLGRMLMESLHTVIFRILMHAQQGDDDGPPLTPAEAQQLGKAIKDIASAKKISADRELKIREAVRKEIEGKARQAADAVGKAIKGAGLSEGAANEIRAKILGVAG